MLLPIMHCVILHVLVPHPWPIKIVLPVIIWIYFGGEASPHPPLNETLLRHMIWISISFEIIQWCGIYCSSVCCSRSPGKAQLLHAEEDN